MFRGRYQIGQEVPLSVLTVNASRVPSFPTVAPHFEVFSSSAKLITGKLMPVMDRNGATGLFQALLRLDARFSAGRHQAVIHYKVGTYYGQQVLDFDILAGGNASGAVEAMHWLERPHANFVVHQLDSGEIHKGRNPRL